MNSGPGVTNVSVVRGGRYYLGPDPGGNGFERVLWAIDENDSARTLSRSLDAYGIAVDASAAILARALRGGRDGGVWSVPLDGGPPSEVVPPVPDRFGRTGLATTSDGTRIATGRCGDGDAGPTLEVVEYGTPRDFGLVGIPVGFSARDELVIWSDCGIGQLELVSAAGDREVLARDANAARVTADGRYVIVWSPREALEDQEIRVVLLESLTSWSVRVDGYWALTGLGDLEYGVFEGTPSGGPGQLQTLVVSLGGQWAAVVDPVPTIP